MGRLISRMFILAVAGCALLVLLGALYVATYPDEADAKNYRYVLWKVGVLKMDPDRALGVMVHDKYAWKLVVGKTKEQLRARFGRLRALNEVSQYLRHAYEQSAWSGRDVLFLRDSAWMVVFNGDVASNLVLVKGV